MVGRRGRRPPGARPTDDFGRVPSSLTRQRLSGPVEGATDASQPIVQRHVAGKREQMNTPVTILDQRYSDSAAVAVTWGQTLELLETAELFWIYSAGRRPA